MPTRLGGKYELGRQIGSGGMGQVFEAVDVETGQAVAAKVMTAGAEIDLQALLRFQQEGAVLATLKHPNIVSVYGTFLEGESCAIVMELIEGRSLGELMRREDLSLARMKVITEQVLSALAFAHSRGIVHRDIKPDNIMVGAGDRVKVTDFGIARVLAPGSTLNTRTGTAIGTPYYMSPEQIEGQRVDGRSDLYSLGTVLYQVVTGRPPFEGDDPLTVAFQHVHKAPAPPSDLNGEVPEDWEAVILRALAKNPADRFQSADAMGSAVSRLSTVKVQPETRHRRPDTVDRIISPEISAELPAALPTTPIEPRGPAPRPSRPRSTGSRMPRLNWLYVSAAIGLIAVVALALLGYRPQATKRAQPTASVRSTAGGGLLAVWGGRGSGPGQLTEPYGIAIGPSDRVYVADYDNNRISVFGPAGKPIQQWQLRAPDGTYVSPAGVAVDAKGDMYASDSDYGRILEISPSGTLLRTWGTRGSKSGQLQDPGGLALDSHGNLLVVDQGNSRIVRFSPTGKVLALFGSKGSSAGQFDYPTSVAVLSNGDILVVDQANYRVQRFSPAGKPLVAWGSAGRGAGEFQAAAGIAVGPVDHVFVTDSTLGRMQEFSPAGKLLHIWTHRRFKRLIAPVAVAVDHSGNIYVADSTTDQIRKFAPVR